MIIDDKVRIRSATEVVTNDVYINIVVKLVISKLEKLNSKIRKLLLDKFIGSRD